MRCPPCSSERLALTILLGLLASTPAAGQEREDRVEGWRSDLDVLSDSLPARHVDLFFRTARAEWMNELERLKGEVPALTDHQVLTRLMRIAALPGDGHTAVRSTGRLPLRALPLALRLFDDGMHVVATDGERAAWLGARVVAIDGVPIEEATARATPIIAHDNASGLAEELPRVLATPELLHGLGIARAAERVTYTLVTPGREPANVEVHAVEPSLVEWLPREGALPLYLTHTHRFYWWTPLEEGRTVYFQYNRCANEDSLTVADFSARVLRHMDTTDVRRVIVDLRHNSGGSSILLAPFVAGVRQWLERTPGAELYAITGRRTFSSALMNAVHLKRVGAVLVGEPTGGKPNHHGEVRSMTLPWSRVRVSYSTKYFTLLPDEDSPTLEPDVPIGLTSDDWLAGRDPVLEAILAGKALR